MSLGNILKPLVSEISNQLHESLKNGGVNGLPTFQDLLRSTSTWDKYKELVEAKYKELVGSEKQVEWAKKIRQEKTDLYLIGHVSNIWDMNAQKRGERGFGVKMTEEEQMNCIRVRNREFYFLFSAQASKIIDNRF
jgi:hypothetical protein